MRLNFLPYLQFVDNVDLNLGAGGKTVATKDVAGVQHQQVIVEYDDGGTGTVKASAANPFPVTDATLAAKDFATQTTLALVKAKTDNLDLAITALRDALRGAGSKSFTDLDTDLATLHTDLGTVHTDLTTLLTTSDFDTKIGSLTETAPTTDTASSGINGRLQRIAQRLTTLIGSTIAISAASLPLPSGAALEAGNLATIAAKDFATQTTLALVKAKTDNLDLAVTALRDALRGVNSKTLSDLDTDLATLHTDLGLLLTVSDFDTKTGSLTETAPASDTASSGLNGRLQRVAQRLSSLIALLPAALDGSGFLKVHEQGTSPSSIADGQDVALGALADAIVAAGATGSVSAKLRRATQGLEDLKTLIVLAAGANKIGSVDIANAVAVGKGTQGANAVPTQDLKDSGRVHIALTIEVAGAATSEGLATVTESRDGGATGTFTSKLITSGKRIRFQSIALAVETLGSGTAPQRVYLRLRVNTAGATTTSSPEQGVWCVINNAAIVKSGAFAFYNIPDGFEILGDGTKTYGITLTFPDWVTSTATVQVKATINAFEY